MTHDTHRHATLPVLALSVGMLLLAGCAVGPNYRRPTVNVPDAYRGVDSREAATTETASLGDQKWSEVFQDEQLRRLIQAALQQNYDVRRAAARILHSHALLGVTRADQLQALDAGETATCQRS
ncbi:MAG: efflux transporter outer membrane subunit, partial [Terriglobia bacterium]